MSSMPQRIMSAFAVFHNQCSDVTKLLEGRTNDRAPVIAVVELQMPDFTAEAPAMIQRCGFNRAIDGPGSGFSSVLNLGLPGRSLVKCEGSRFR